MVTIKDIAARLGIAVSTVSKGLNGASDISEEMRQLILETSIEMGYKTKKMKKQENKKLCIFVENMDFSTETSFGYDIVLGFKQEAAKDHWSVDVIAITPSMQTQQKYDSYMLENGYSGGFFLGFALEDDWMYQIKTAITPTVMFDNYVEKNPHVCNIGTDSYEGINACVDLLYKLGHRNIGFLNGSTHSYITEQRTRAFIRSMESHNIDYDPELIRYGHYVAESAKYHVPFFIEKEVTAVICASDLIAMGVIAEYTQRGYHVPEDISVTGFDDLPIAKDLLPPLTTIRQDRQIAGKTGYTALSALMKNIPISKTTMRARVIERDSTAPVKHNTPTLSAKKTDLLN